MKKRWPKVLAVMLFLIVFAGVLFYTLVINDLIPASGEEKSEITAVSIQNGDLKISVDPRIELLSSVQLVSKYKLLGRLTFQYKNDMDNYFKSFKDHDAVKHCTWMASHGFTYDAPPTVMLHLSDPPFLKQIALYDNQLKLRGSGTYNLRKFSRLLKDYSLDSDFTSFYNNNNAYYKKIVEDTSMSLQDADIVKDLEDYYGIKQKSYNLILAPLFHPGGYGIKVNEENGIFDTYAIIGPYKTEDQIPVYDGKEIRELIWHEFSHSFINPLNESHKNEISRYSSLYEPIKIIMKSSAYTNWETCVNEHLVRAVTTRLAYLKLGVNEGDAALQYEKKCGFIYIEELCNKLKVYEENRDQYKTLDDFYTEILKSFDRLLKLTPDEISKLIKYEGPINGAITGLNPVVLIVPTNESDKDTEEKINNYVKAIKDKFFKDGKIITDKDSIEADLSGNTIIAYGTMEGNLWLSKYKETFPFKIEPDKVVADTTYEGKGYKYICGFKNPQNENNPVLIYTAQSASDIAGINSIFHGPTDYVIAKGDEIIKSGNFVREDGKWSY